CIHIDGESSAAYNRVDQVALDRLQQIFCLPRTVEHSESTSDRSLRGGRIGQADSRSEVRLHSCIEGTIRGEEAIRGRGAIDVELNVEVVHLAERRVILVAHAV